MATAPKASGGGYGGESDFEVPPAGTYVGRCIKIIDLGTQDDTYEGTPVKKRKIQFMWELGSTKMTDGRPFIVGREFGFSVWKNANLRKVLHDWIGQQLDDAQAEAFDFKNLLGKNCMVCMGPNKNGKMRVLAISKRPDGKTPGTIAVPAAPAVNEQVAFFLTKEEFDPVAFGKLSEHWRTKIMASPEYGALVGPPPTDGQKQETQQQQPPQGSDDDIPF